MNVAALLTRLKKDAADEECREAKKESGEDEGVLGRFLPLLHNAYAISYFAGFLQSIGKQDVLYLWLELDALQYLENETETKTAINAIIKRYCSGGEFDTNILTNETIEGMACFKSSSIEIARKCVLKELEERYFYDFQEDVFYKKLELEVLSDPERISVNDLICNRNLLPSFLEMVEERREEEAMEDRHSIHFLIATDTWRGQLSELASTESRSDAFSINERFISQNGQSRISLSEENRQRIGKLVRNHSSLSSSIFDEARMTCLRHLHQRYMEAVLQSSWLSDYSASLRSAIERGGKRSSDGREDSVSFSSPSFTTSLSSVLQVQLNQIDSVRSSPSRSTKLAEVDCLGRYRPLFDTSLISSDSPSSSVSGAHKIRDAFLKYMDKNRLRPEEDPEEVARAIIADIETMVNGTDDT